VVVNGQTSTPIGLSANSADPLNIVLDPYGVTQTLAGASGGTIGGLKTFVSQVLQPAQSGLNTLAQTFVSQINSIQAQGVDGYGQPGQDLMKVDPAVTNAAEGMSVIQSDGMRIATGAQFRVTENTSNPDAVKSVVNYTKPAAALASSNPDLVNNPNPSAGLKINIQGDAQYQNVTTLAAGVNNPVFYLDNAQPGQELQLLTTDGRQLIGSPLTTDQQFQILTPTNGFSQPVTYNTQYLNQSGTQGYMGTSVFYGAKSDPIPIQQFDGSGNALPPKLTNANLVTNQINLGQTGTVIQAGAIELDGVPLGELNASTGPLNANGQPTLSISDVQNWIQSANLPDITVTKFTQISTPASKIDFTKPLSIMDPNGNMVDIGTIPPGGTKPTQYNDMKSLVQAIQASSAQTQVTASIDAGGDLVITNLPGPGNINLGNPITLGPSTGFNALGTAGQTYSGQLSISRTLADPGRSSVEFSFGTNGTPFDLSKVGLRTGAYISGPVPDDVHVVVTGQGATSVAASFSGLPQDPQQKLRNQSIAINFTSANHYTINDVKTGTELASRNYDNTVNNPVVNFQGLSIKLSAPPVAGDSFQIDGNQDGLGNNQNMLVMANLANQKVLNGMTMGDNYTNQVNSVGNVSQQATITQQALTVVNKQAVASRDAVSGVNLDDEATSLIKYQQAYEAAAKAMQIGTSLFSTIEAIRA
jgi:flagellar hook-associated protein FlgK